MEVLTIVVGVRRQVVIVVVIVIIVSAVIKVLGSTLRLPRE